MFVRIPFDVWAGLWVLIRPVPEVSLPHKFLFKSVLAVVVGVTHFIIEHEQT